MDLEVAVIQDWYAHAMMSERYTEGYRAPVVARMYAYLGIAGYETARRNGNAPGYVSAFLPAEFQCALISDDIHLASALNACYARLLEHFMVFTTKTVEDQRRALRNRWSEIFESNTDPETIQRSEAWGIEVADAVFTWAATDTLGHRAELHNYDRTYVPPTGPGMWVPSREFPMPPLLPYCGRTRTFAVSVGDIEIQPQIPYSEDRGSAYYKQVYELYALSSPLSAENIWIAEFWSDDLPGLTLTPAGRWINIAHQLMDLRHPALEKTLETYLKAGIALSDAAVICWKGKYQFNSQRPEDYIRKCIDPDWLPLHPAPPFPGYPSGHSAMGASVAGVLTHLYGDNVRFTDRCHEGRKEFKGAARHFNRFEDMARESAFSRLAMGVHIRSDCEEGLRLGTLIGQYVADIQVFDPSVEDITWNSR